VSEKACHAERCIAERSISFGRSVLKGRTFAQAQEDRRRIVHPCYGVKPPFILNPRQILTDPAL